LRCCGRLNSRAAYGFRPTPAPANLASKVGFWPFQVCQPSAILTRPALVNRMPPKTSSMYPSSISRALCSDGMRCIKPLAPSRNETNSSRVNGGAVGAILGICSHVGRDQAEFVAIIKLVQSPGQRLGISVNQQTARLFPTALAFRGVCLPRTSRECFRPGSFLRSHRKRPLHLEALAILCSK
jgi:hypothetical protein